MAAFTLSAEQWALIGATYVLFFLLPAAWMWRKAQRDGDAPLTWALLVAVASFLGVIEYRKHRSILQKRARRAQRERQQPQDPPER